MIRDVIDTFRRATPPIHQTFYLKKKTKLNKFLSQGLTRNFDMSFQVTPFCFPKLQNTVNSTKMTTRHSLMMSKIANFGRDEKH